MKRFLSAIAAFFAVLILVAQSPAAENYAVDPVHSSVIFRAKHANAGYVYGRFNSFAGAINVDDDPSRMAFDATVQVESIDTANAKRDTHLKSPDFFSAKEFPTISFKSTSVKSAGEGKYDVTGDLKLHGQTRPITITVMKTGQSDTPQFGKRIGYHSTFSIKRSDFGMTAMPDIVSDQIDLTVAFESVKK